MSAPVAVVGAVIVQGGRVLCALRGGGPLAGLWEFPGGKVEPGEEPRAALRREIAEELGCQIEVGELITTAVHRYEFATVELSTYRCRLAQGEPIASEHSRLAWLAPSELGTLSWAPVDIATVERLTQR